MKYQELCCSLHLWIVKTPFLKSPLVLDLFFQVWTESKYLWKKVLAGTFTDHICVIVQVQSCWIMFLISAQSKIFLRFTCTYRQTMKMPLTFTRNLDLKSQTPSRTITRTLLRLTAIFLQNSSLKQRNNVTELVVQCKLCFFSPIYWTLPWFGCTIEVPWMLLVKWWVKSSPAKIRGPNE